MSVLGVGAVVALALVAGGAVAAGAHLLRGPASPDRAVASDVVVTAFMAAVVVAIAVSGTTTFTPVLLVLALLGFISTSTLARFLGRSDRGGS